MAGTCRNRTYQPPCDGLSGFEDRANHQIRTFPCALETLACKGFPDLRGGDYLRRPETDLRIVSHVGFCLLRGHASDYRLERGGRIRVLALETSKTLLR